MQAKKQKQQVIIHYDNTTSHNSKIVKKYFLDSPFTQMTDPAYIQDIVPCYLRVFRTMKENFEYQEFETEYELLSAIDEFLTSKSQ